MQGTRDIQEIKRSCTAKWTMFIFNAVLSEITAGAKKCKNYLS